MNYVSEQYIEEAVGNKINNKGFTVTLSIYSRMELIFETNERITGVDSAQVIVDNVKKLTDLKIGKKFKASFRRKSYNLTFKDILDEDWLGPSPPIKGKYSGEGILQKGKQCDLTFTSNILKGKYNLSSSGNLFILTRIS